MIHEEVKQVAEQFSRLELHAARGGREVRRVLVAVAGNLTVETGEGLLGEVRENIAYLLKFLPPYAPPLNSINQILVYLEQAIDARMSPAQIQSSLDDNMRDSSTASQNAFRIANFLEELLPAQAVLYTHTLSETVLNSLLELHRRGKIRRVLVTESRPNNDGWDTSRRLSEQGVNTCLTIDAAMPDAIAQADCMVSGAEIINRDGSVIGKVGAFPAAVFCRMAGKPVYVLADTGKISLFDHADYYLTPFTAKDMGVELVGSMRVTGSYFDVTPGQYIRAVVTENGAVAPEAVITLTPKTPVSQWLRDRLTENPARSSHQEERK